MDEPLNSLDGWVAFKPTIFGETQANNKAPIEDRPKQPVVRYNFLVAWNHNEQLLAVTCLEGHRKVSDDKSKAKARTMRYVCLQLSFWLQL